MDTIEQASPPLHYEGQLWSPETAAAALAEFDADADRVKAALGGDIAAQRERAAYREMARGRQPGAIPEMPLDAGAVAQQMGERDQMIHESRLDAFARHVRMTPELRAQMSRRLATQEQSDFAKAERVRLLKDGAFTLAELRRVTLRKRRSSPLCRRWPRPRSPET